MQPAALRRPPRPAPLVHRSYFVTPSWIPPGELARRQRTVDRSADSDSLAVVDTHSARPADFAASPTGMVASALTAWSAEEKACRYTTMEKACRYTTMFLSVLCLSKFVVGPERGTSFLHVSLRSFIVENPHVVKLVTA